MTRIVRPFLLLPRGGLPATGGGDDTPQVVKDFRPANTIPQVAPAETAETDSAPDPKALTTQDSSATGSASDSPGGASENETPGTSTGPSQSSSSDSSESPADAEKARLLHPSGLTTTGKTEPPAEV